MVREIVQNGLDEDDQGRVLKVWHDGTHLMVSNAGADMDGQAMLLGHSDKGPDQRGRHGEGLNLAMLVAARMDLGMEIYTKTEKWVPYIGMSSTFNGRVLCVRTQKLRKLRDDVTVSVRLPAEDWERVFRNRFLKFVPFETLEILRSWQGAIIFKKEFKGMIFVKGIYVMTDPNLRNGFDFNEAELDRDRSMMSSWNMHWAIGCIWDSLMQQVKDLAPRAFQLAMEDAPELEGFQYMQGIKEAVKDQFIAAFGMEAVPVLSIEESMLVESAGFNGVVVPARFQKMLMASSVPTIEQIIAGHGREIKQRYNADQLNDIDRAMLAKVKNVILRAAERVRGMPEACQQYSIREGWSEFQWPHVCVSEFNDDKYLALWSSENGESFVHIRPGVLGNFRLALMTIVHEMAHHATKSVDGTPNHTRALEELWSLLYHTKGINGASGSA